MKEISKRNSCIIWGIVSVLIGIVYEIVCQKVGAYVNFSIDRIFIVTAIMLCIGIHYIFGIKKVYDFIIEKRYALALICLIVFTALGYSGSSIGAISSWILEPEANNTVLGNYRFIRSDEYGVEALVAGMQKTQNNLSYFTDLARATKTDVFATTHAPVFDLITFCREYNLGYFILSFDMAFAFAWNFKMIALILVTFEFFQIITNNKKYFSLVGSILISFSSFIAWWGAVDLVIFGELALIALEYFMKTDKIKFRLAWSVVLAYSIISYIFSLYPAWMISFGYVFLALAIWIIIKNWKKYKFNKLDIACAVLVFGLVLLFLGRFFFNSHLAIKEMFNTEYPGSRIETGGKGIAYLFSYGYSFMLPFVQTQDNMLYASLLSLFPLPLIMGMYYVYKKEKHYSFIMPIGIILVLESLWCMVGFPEIIAKYTLFSIVPVQRCAIAVALGSIYLYMYMISNIEENFISLKNSIKIVLIVLILFFCIDRPDVLETSKGYMYLFSAVLSLAYFLMLNMLDKRYTKFFLGFVVIWTLISGVFVNPITKGTSIITDTKLAKAVQVEALENKDAIWITENMDMVVSNYLMANGAKTLNSTNFYPNEEFWKLILDEEYSRKMEIWSRYAHIRIRFTENETSIRLDGEDKIIVDLNYDKLTELGVEYIVSYKEKEELENGVIALNTVYNNSVEEAVNIEGKQVENIYIYEIVN